MENVSTVVVFWVLVGGASLFIMWSHLQMTENFKLILFRLERRDKSMAEESTEQEFEIEIEEFVPKAEVNINSLLGRKSPPDFRLHENGIIEHRKTGQEFSGLSEVDDYEVDIGEFLLIKSGNLIFFHCRPIKKVFQTRYQPDFGWIQPKVH
jgi:hypothetical protein